MRKKIISVLTIWFIVFSSLMVFWANQTVEASENDIYDIVLFWGQSNMVGWPNTNGKMPNGFENTSQFSKDTDIEQDILFFTESTSKVITPLESETAYIYKYLTNSFDEIKSDTEILGDGFDFSEYNGSSYETSRNGLSYNPSTKRLERYNLQTSSHISIETSRNVNMIPEFCKTYYERTGHKVIAVTGAVGGVGIQYFLPHNDPNHQKSEKCDYMYEAIVENFNGAVRLANSKGYTIGKKYWVCFQGESNISSNKSDYERYFTQVKENLKKDLGTTLGAIVETSNEVGTNGIFANVKGLHEAQENLIKNNDDIILGSSFAYDHYVPDEVSYRSNDYTTQKFLDSSGQKLPYNTALAMAKKCFCAEHTWFGSGTNAIHLHSASLSQIGREVANNLADSQYEMIGTNVKATFDYFSGQVTLSTRLGGGIGVLDQTSFRRFVNNCGLENIRSIRFTGPIRLSASDSSGIFANLPNLRSFYNMDYLITQNVTDFSNMFLNCRNLIVLNLGSWDMSKATNTAHMFQGCKSLLSVSVETWNTANITNMAGMFQECSGLSLVNMSKWNMSKVTDTTDMFQECSSMTSIYTPKIYSSKSIILPNDQWYNRSNSNDNNIYSEVRNGMFSESVHLEKLINYQITYDLDGGAVTGNPETYNALSSFILENPTKTGYTFDGWTGSNGTTKQKKVSINGREMTQNLSYKANWVASKDTTYQVKHWQQNVNGNANHHDDSNYSLKETENRMGQTGATITPPTKSYSGFTAPTSESITITEDGKAEVNYYYTRNKYHVTLTKDEGIQSISGENDYYYEQEVTIRAEVKDDYIWRNWTGAQSFESKQNTFEMPTQNIEFRANTVKKASVTTKYIDGNTGKEIAESVVEEGYEGKEYTTTEKKIDGYELVRIEGVPEGRMTGNRTVTYVMAKTAKIEIYYFDQTNDKMIADTKIVGGYVGKQYEVKPMQINGYQHSYSSDNTVGVMTEEIIKIYFGYLKQTGVNVKYVDVNTNEEIAQAKHYDCLATEEYDVTKDYQEIDGFTFVEDSGNTIGTSENEGIDVIYYYAYNTSVEIKYYDVFTNKEITNSEEIKGYEGKAYEVSEKEIDGYSFTKLDDAKGNMKREKIELRAYYTKQISIELKYFDYYTKEPIRDDELIQGLQGEDYDVTEKVENIEGYELYQKATNMKGKIGADKIEIINYYVKKLRVTVKYIDIDTKEEIKAKKEYHYVAGDTYYLKGDIEKIEGYEYVNTKGEVEGKLEKKDVIIELYYKKEKKSPDTNSDKNNSSNNSNKNNTTSNKNDSSNNTNSNSGKDNTIFKGNIPKAGKKAILLPVIGIMILITFKMYRNYKKYDDIDKQ